MENEHAEKQKGSIKTLEVVASAVSPEQLEEAESKDAKFLSPIIVHSVELQQNKAIKPVKKTLSILLGVSIIGGFIVGVALKYSKHDFTKREIYVLSFPGEIFLRMLQGVTIPLVTSSIVASIGSIDISLAGKIAKRSFLYYMTTTIVATIIGISIVTAVKPGTSVSNNITLGQEKWSRPVSMLHTILDIFRNIFPDNLILACLNSTQTKTVPIPGFNRSDGSKDPEKYDIVITSIAGTNVLGILVFSIITGIVLISLPARNKNPILEVVVALTEAMMLLTLLMMFYAPIGVASLIIGAIIKADDPIKFFQSVGLFSFCVIFGMIIHISVVYVGLYKFFVKKGFFRFLGQFSPALFTSFGTSSSAATIPASIQALIAAGIDKRIVKFMVPVGATVNMDGAALYEAVAIVFFSQVHKRELSWGELVVVAVSATFTSIGAAGIPSGSLIALLMMTTTMNIPSEDIALVAPIDWILDRFQTSMNVLGDAIGCSIVNSLLSKELNAEKKLSTSLQ